MGYWQLPHASACTCLRLFFRQSRSGGSSIRSVYSYLAERVFSALIGGSLSPVVRQLVPQMPSCNVYTSTSAYCHRGRYGGGGCRSYPDRTVLSGCRSHWWLVPAWLVWARDVGACPARGPQCSRDPAPPSTAIGFSRGRDSTGRYIRSKTRAFGCSGLATGPKG